MKLDVSSLSKAIAQLEEALEYSVSKLATQDERLALHLVWKEYRRERGTTNHTYDEDKAQEVFENIPDFLQDAKYLLDQLKQRQAQNLE